MNVKFTSSRPFSCDEQGRIKFLEVTYLDTSFGTTKLGLRRGFLFAEWLNDRFEEKTKHNMKDKK
jgi:hypothetical protein